MKARSIALIGFRATGKTSVGRLLAPMLGWDFVDMDQALVQRLGMDIQSWVQQHGWDSFRNEEAALLEELSGKPNLVVATGGGIVEREANRQTLRDHFHTIWLKAPAEAILARLETDPATSSQRPALTDMSREEEVREVLLRRTSLYNECALMDLDTEGLSPQDGARRIMDMPAVGSWTDAPVESTPASAG